MTKFTDHFNSTTIRGRANVAKATYASFAAIYLYSRFKKSRNKNRDNWDNKATTTDNKETSAASAASAASSPSEDKQNLQNFRCPKCECNNKTIIEDSDVKAEVVTKELPDTPAPIETDSGKKESCNLYYNQDNNGAVTEYADKSITIKCEPSNGSETIDGNIEAKRLKTAADIDLWWISH
ncbi:uncharacterized protein ACRADG_007339 [Cochliomyia hominivorax]